MSQLSFVSSTFITGTLTMCLSLLFAATSTGSSHSMHPVSVTIRFWWIRER